MVKRTFLLTLIFIISSCAPTKTSIIPGRYESVKKQKSYVSLRFQMNSKNLIGKTKEEVIRILGQPIRIQKKVDEIKNNELWIYYPQNTNNFIAIIITFEKERVKTCAYESVM